MALDSLITNCRVTDVLIHPDVSQACFPLAVSRALIWLREKYVALSIFNGFMHMHAWMNAELSWIVYLVIFKIFLSCLWRLGGGGERVHPDSWSLVSAFRCAESVIRTKCNQMKWLWLCLNAAIKSLWGNTQEVKVALHFSAQQGWLSSPN